MDAALELFASKGYSNCSISQLSAHVGISKGLMYNLTLEGTKISRVQKD